MKEVTIYPGRLRGSIKVPPSKSMCHRAIICAGLSKGTSIINNIGVSQDIKATLEAMGSLGMSVEAAGTSLVIKGNPHPSIKDWRINCRESGSTLRFIIPIAALTGEPVVFCGEGRLVERSLVPYFYIFEKQGIKYQTNGGKLPLYINGRLAPGEFCLKGDISSQFISGLMFALPLLEADSTIRMATELQSRPYLDLTIKALKEFSIEIENHGYESFSIKGNQSYRAADYTVEGDYSQAAFWLAAGALGSDISCSGLDIKSAQGDKAILSIIVEMGGGMVFERDTFKSLPSELKGTIIDAAHCPDLVPVLAVLGALSEGGTEIINAKRLRLKESDRLKAIASELGKLGACIRETQDGLVIDGVKKLRGGRVDSWNDHRIAMALAVAATRAEEPVTISNASSVEKSYPDFWEHYRALGGRISIINGN